MPDDVEHIPLGPLKVPLRPDFHYPTDWLNNKITRLRLFFGGRATALPLSPEYIFVPLDGLSASTTETGGEKPECDDARVKAEFDRLADAYVRVVQRNLANGWVWGPHGNIQITLGLAQLGSCSDWQADIYNALCALPNIHCWQICEIRSAWHRAVVVYPKNAWWWRWGGIVFDPWFFGGPYAYTVGQWFMWAGLNWRGNCCK